MPTSGRPSGSLSRATKFALMAALAVAGASLRVEAALEPPAGFKRELGRVEVSASPCKPSPRPLTGQLTLPNRYANDPDGGADDTNPEARTAKLAALRPALELESGIRRQVDLVLTGAGGNVDCVLEWMVTWSEAGAFLNAGTDTGYVTARNWTVATLGASWIQLKSSAPQMLKKDSLAVRKVDNWFAAVSEEIMQAYAGRKQGKDFNNHVYWASWAVMSAAVILDDCERFNWAIGNLDVAMRQVRSDGVLINELQRKKMALNYHNFSIQPLSMIAAFAVANGHTLTDEQSAALGRLATLVVEGLNNPKVIEARAGAPQIHHGGPHQFAFLEPYCWALDCPAPWRAQLAALRPVKERRLGGDLSLLFATTPRQENITPACVNSKGPIE